MAEGATVSLKDVQALRPAHTEIIVCTGLRIRVSWVQYWGDGAAGLFCDRKQR